MRITEAVLIKVENPALLAAWKLSYNPCGFGAVFADILFDQVRSWAGFNTCWFSSCLSHIHIQDIFIRHDQWGSAEFSSRSLPLLWWLPISHHHHLYTVSWFKKANCQRTTRVKKVSKVWLSKIIHTFTCLHCMLWVNDLSNLIFNIFFLKWNHFLCYFRFQIILLRLWCSM